MKNYFGPETKKALKNFPFSTHPVKTEFILGIIKIKRSAAVANYHAKNLNKNISNAIVKVCDEILNGRLKDQFILSSFQGGAGTAINMNINEVIASRATEILGAKVIVHPNDHVNRSQSTNDVNPSAIKIAVTKLLKELDANLTALIKSFEIKAKAFAKVQKLGRTHMQDAVPTTLGAEFLAYAEVLKAHLMALKQVSVLSRVLNLSGTAIGTGINASVKYKAEVYKELNKITKDKFVAGKNLIAMSSGQYDFVIISQSITALCVSLSKIANDFKFMSSGPRGGIGELILPELQKGSSIMPGKINPVMPETLNQLYFLVSGNNISIEKSVEAAQMELGAMLPIIADKLLESIQLTSQTVKQFDNLCVSKIRANVKKCREHLDNSTALATYLTPKFGYDKISDLVKKTLHGEKSFKSVVIENGFMKEKEWQMFVKTLKI